MSEEQQPPPLPAAAAGPSSFKPPRLTNRQALDLRKRAVMGAATQHNHHLDAVQEDALDGSMQECSLASEPGQQQQQHARQRSIPLGSWDAYWDSRQQVVSGR